VACPPDQPGARGRSWNSDNVSGLYLFLKNAAFAKRHEIEVVVLDILEYFLNVREMNIFFAMGGYP
jgi:hypothetical protein